MNLNGVTNVKYPWCLLKELNIPFSTVVDKDFFTYYKNDNKKEESRNSQGYYEYTNTINTINKVSIHFMLENENESELEIKLSGSYTGLFDYLKTHNVFTMQYCLEMDLFSSAKAQQLFFDDNHVSEDNRNIRYILVDNKKAIKDITNLLPIFNKMKPSDYPNSFKKIRLELVKQIQNEIQ